MSNFMPHGFCMRWNEWLLFLHVFSDAFIALAYFSIPLALMVFIRKRKDMQFGFLFWLFSLFIFSCGLTHLFSIFTLWYPDYWSEGWLKFVTAAVSVTTAVALWPTIPKALKIPSQAALEKSNAELRKANERALEAVEEARMSEKAKDEFLAVMSHELRTPMNSIIGFADLLDKEKIPSEQQDYVHTIQQSGSTLLRIIDDILDLSSLSAGKMQIKPHPLSPAGLVEEVSSMLHHMATSKGLKFRCEAAADLPEGVLGDRGRILQILLNLASNAIKFCHEGEVSLVAKPGPHPSAPGRRVIDYVVSDTGPGVAKEDIERIFNPFVQVDSGVNRRHSGTGLGLPISKKLAVLMGGDLTCESVAGKGSVFTFRCEYSTCRIVASEDAGISHPATVKHFPLRILLAEDDPINRKLMAVTFKKMGYTASLAANGAEAVEIYSQSPHDCIFMDMQMPDIDGIEATRRIRSFEASHSELCPVYISALTANVLPQDRNECLAAGMNEVLTKPVKLPAIRAALERAQLARSFYHHALDQSSDRGGDAASGTVSSEKIHRIVYVSTAVHPFSKDDLLALLKQSRDANAMHGITGILLYRNGNFLQLFEGPEAKARQLYENIDNDPRHHHRVKLFEGAVIGRAFSDWTMAFHDMNDPNLQNVTGFSNFLDTPIDLSAIARNPSIGLELVRAFAGYYQSGKPPANTL